MRNCTRFIQCPTWYETALLRAYKPVQNQTFDKDRIAFNDRLSYVQYLPAKPIKKGFKVCMFCNADTAYLHQFEVYLSWQQNSEFGLGYDVVMKVCKDISGKHPHVYCLKINPGWQLKLGVHCLARQWNSQTCQYEISPRNVVHTDRRLGCDVIQVNQPQNIWLYKG